MIDVIISSESTCDLNDELIKKYDIRLVHMKFSVDGVEYNSKDDSVETSNLYKKMREGKKTETSLVNAHDYSEYFKNLLSEGKPVLHLTMSSGLSSTYSSAKIAADEINEHSETKVYVIDSLCGCSGQGMMAILARIYSGKANSIAELVEYVKETRLKLRHIFTVDALKYLANGGRIKPSVVFLGTLLNIKPLIRMDNNGKLEMTGKVISRKKALNSLFDNLKKTYSPNEEICFISHSDCPADAEYLKHLIEAQTTLRPVITNIGPVFGSHCGPGAVAVYYLANDR